MMRHFELFFARQACANVKSSARTGGDLCDLVAAGAGAAKTRNFLIAAQFYSREAAYIR